MYMSTLLTAVATATLVAANPIELEKRATCASSGTFPWFIGPHHDTRCSDQPPNFQPASGSPPGNAVRCQPLDPSNRVGFASAAVNTPCSDFPYAVTLYSTIGCTDRGVTTTVPACLAAPNGGQFFAYSTVRRF